jgi:hypothetical protein
MTPWPPRASDPSNGRPSPPAAPEQRPPSATQARWLRLDPSAQIDLRHEWLRDADTYGRLSWFRFHSYLVPVEV